MGYHFDEDEQHYLMVSANEPAPLHTTHIISRDVISSSFRGSFSGGFPEERFDGDGCTL